MIEGDYELHPLDGQCARYKTGEVATVCACGAAATWHNNLLPNRTERFKEGLCEGCAVELRILLALKG